MSTPTGHWANLGRAPRLSSIRCPANMARGLKMAPGLAQIIWNGWDPVPYFQRSRLQIKTRSPPPFNHHNIHKSSTKLSIEAIAYQHASRQFDTPPCVGSPIDAYQGSVGRGVIDVGRNGSAC